MLAAVLTVCGIMTLNSCRSADNAVNKARQSIVILFETDVHCAIDGYAKIAGLRDAVADTAWTALVSSGDFLQADGTYVPLLPTAIYTVASTDYATINGGFRGLFAGCTVLQYTTTLYRDALVQYVTDVLGGNIDQQYAAPQGRITIFANY